MGNQIIGEIILFVLGATIPQNHMIADGRCLDIREYSELADAIHDGDNWPYGKCEENKFKLPDLRSKQSKAVYLIKVR